METTIYIKLIDEEIDVWRPVVGQQKSENTFLILKDARNVVRDGEIWEFQPGTHVLVKEQVSDGESILVAIKEIKK